MTPSLPDSHLAVLETSVEAAGRPTGARRLRLSAPDPLSARAMAATRLLPPHERYLLVAGCTLRELARREGVAPSRISAIFAEASQGRLSAEWAGRLAAVVGATPGEIYTLFGIRTPEGSPSAARGAAANGAPHAGTDDLARVAS